MEPITIIEGEALHELLERILKDGYVYRIRIHQAADGSGVKVKVNEGTWTYWIGKADA